MSLTPNLFIHHLIAKCLLLADDRIKHILQDKLDTNEIETDVGASFNKLLSAMLLDDLIKQSKIREIYCSELFDGIGEISLPIKISNEASHHENHMDMMFVVAIAAYLKAKNIFEFGTYLGRTTCGFVELADDVTVHTLNLPPEDDLRYGPYIGRYIKTSPHRERIHQIFSNSFAFAPDVYAQRMDFIFIDADHSYDAVKNDTQKAFQMLKPGGTIVWHDFAPKSPGVIKYLCELSMTKSIFRIKNTCLVVYLDNIDVTNFTPKERALFLEDINPLYVAI